MSESNDPAQQSAATPTPGAPSDNASMTAVVEQLTEVYPIQFEPQEDAAVRCAQCDGHVPAADLDVRVLRRFEGASDPDDMATVVAAICPQCGGGGTVVLGYGVNASPIDADIARGLRQPTAAHYPI